MKELAKLPELPAFKFNKRTNSFTPVVRVYTMKSGAVICFKDLGGTYCYYKYPFCFWTPITIAFPRMLSFFNRICGLTAEGSN